MDKYFSTFVSEKNAPIFLILLFSLSVLVGCSQNRTHFIVDHPGKYDLIDVGPVNIKPDSNLPYKLHAYKVHDKIIHAFSSVMYPSYFSIHLLENTEVHEGESVLDIGTGTGVQAIFAADNASHVLAMDISEDALKNTLHNARLFGVSDKVSVRKSDLFNALKPDEKFDVITSTISLGARDNWKLQERFFRDAGKHLKPDGRIYFLTGRLDNMPQTRILAEENGFKIISINMTYARIQHIEPIVYVFKHKNAAMWTQEDLMEEKQNK